MGVVQFDTTRNKFLAVGDDYTIKVWDMDNVNLLGTIDAEGGLPVSFPSSVHRLCFASVPLNLWLSLYITFSFQGNSSYPLQQGGLFVGCFCK